MELKDKFRKGLMDMLVLKVLSRKDSYAYQIAQTLENVSQNAVTFAVPSMYPLLNRLQRQGFVSSYFLDDPKHRERVYYHIEPAGREQLDLLTEAYSKVKNGVEAIFNYSISDMDE